MNLSDPRQKRRFRELATLEHLIGKLTAPVSPYLQLQTPRLLEAQPGAATTEGWAQVRRTLERRAKALRRRLAKNG